MLNKEISVINSPTNTGFFYEEILSPINNYLIKNKGAVGDFNLIKDIVDRSLDVEEEEISGNLPLPLYLGLFGTMLGIIISLVNISLQTSGNEDSELIKILLSGVKISMIASAIGIVYTGI